eukprot:gene422-11792_t
MISSKVVSSSPLSRKEREAVAMSLAQRTLYMMTLKGVLLSQNDEAKLKEKGGDIPNNSEFFFVNSDPRGGSGCVSTLKENSSALKSPPRKIEKLAALALGVIFGK